MKIDGEAKLLRIFLGESDKSGHVTLAERIVIQARKSGLAGATCFKGIMGFGRSSIIHTSKILTLSDDLPVIIEIADTAEKLDAFIPEVDKLFEECGCGGLITIEKIQIIKYC